MKNESHLHQGGQGLFSKRKRFVCVCVNGVVHPESKALSAEGCHRLRASKCPMPALTNQIEPEMVVCMCAGRCVWVIMILQRT